MQSTEADIIGACCCGTVGCRYPAVPDYVDFAFTTARAAGGDEVKLFYNDYNVASSLGFSQAKSDKMCAAFVLYACSAVLILSVSTHSHHDQP